MDSLLVIGANGKIGQELVLLAAKKGYNVKAAIRDKEKAESINIENVTLIEFDFNKPETWEEALTETDFVFLLASAQLDNPYEEVKPFIEYLNKSKIKHTTFSTAMGVEQSDNNPLRLLEKEIENSAKPYTLLRPTWFMQNFFTSLKSKIKEEGKLILPAGDSKTSFIDTRDIAECALKSFHEESMKNRAFKLTGGESLTHYQVVDYISKATGKEVKYIPVMLVEYRDMLMQMGLSEHKADGIISIFDMMAKGFTDYITDNVEKILGRKPITFQKFAQDYAEKWQ